MIFLIYITLVYGVFGLVGILLLSFRKPIIIAKPICDSVSIIVAFRNEEKNINRLVKGLVSQQYPLSIEFIFVDDNSSDQTINLLKRWACEDKRITVLSNEGDGKKLCVSRALKFVSNPIVIQTDADCEVGPYWLMSSVKKLLSSNYDMILGPVYPFKSKNILNRFMRLEWLALQFISALTSKLKNAGIANAANIIFYKSDYEDFIRSNYGKNYASGDDMFFMRFLQKKRKKIGFNLAHEAIVKTEMPRSLVELVQQRIRWSTKIGKTTNMITYCFTLIVISANFGWIFSLIFFEGNNNFLKVIGLCAICKFLVDFFICCNMARFYRDFQVLYLLPVMFFLYPLYLFIGLVLTFKVEYYWKGRRVK